MITRRTLLLGIASIPLIGIPLANGVSKVYRPSQVRVTIDGIPINPHGYELIERFNDIVSGAVGIPERLLFENTSSKRR